MISTQSLKEHELSLAFHLATGYEIAGYYPDYKCWRAEKRHGETGLTSISVINDFRSRFHHTAYERVLCEATIIREMRSENICLKWDRNKDYELYFAAMPEISAVSPYLAKAFMMVMVKKELGDILTASAIEAMNLNKTRTFQGSPI